MKNYGWWDHDPEAQSLTNRFTRERVSFAGPCNFDGRVVDPANADCVRFDYSYAGASFPLIGQIRPQLDGFRFWTSDYAPLLIDYEVCAEVWRREQERSEPLPPYGLWANADAAAINALLCRARPTARKYILFKGGWFNGKWSSEFRRMYEGCVPADPQPISDPTFFLLDPTHAVQEKWRCNNKASRLLEEADLDIEESGRKGFPTGFEDKVSYVINQDRTRALFPRQAFCTREKIDRASWGYFGHIVLSYADDLLTVSLRPKTTIKGEFATWEIRSLELMNPVVYDERNRSLGLWEEGKTVVLGEDGGPFQFRMDRIRPNFELWNHIADALAHGWLEWQETHFLPYSNPSYRNRAFNGGEPSAVELPSCDRLIINGGFVAGVPCSSFRAMFTHTLSFEKLYSPAITKKTDDISHDPDNQWAGLVEPDRALRIGPEYEGVARALSGAGLNLIGGTIKALFDENTLETVLAAFLFDIGRNEVEPGQLKRWKSWRPLVRRLPRRWYKIILSAWGLRITPVRQAFLIAIIIYRDVIKMCGESERIQLRQYIAESDPDQAALPDLLLKIRCGIYVALHYAAESLGRKQIEFGVREIAEAIGGDDDFVAHATEFILTGAENLSFGGRELREKRLARSSV